MHELHKTIIHEQHKELIHESVKAPVITETIEKPIVHEQFEKPIVKTEFQETIVKKEGFGTHLHDSELLLKEKEKEGLGSKIMGAFSNIKEAITGEKDQETLKREELERRI